MAQTTQTAKSALPGGFKILLSISLAVNLAVAGLMVGVLCAKVLVVQWAVMRS